MELSLQKRERIERVLRTKLSRQREATPTQKLDALILFVVFSGAALILGTLLLINLQWSPGNQDQIAREHGLRHNAVTVAVEERK